MAIDKVLSASIADAAVNASAISNTANLVIGALNTGNTVITGTLQAGNTTITGNAAANTLSISVAGSQAVNPIQIAISGNGSYMRITSTMAANLTSNGSIVHLMGKANSQFNSGYIGYEQFGDSSSNNVVKLGMYGVDDIINITGRGSVGINTKSPIPHNGNNALVVSSVGDRGIIELWEGSGTGGKAVFQQVGGTTYVGSLAKGTGNGHLILLANGTGSSATEAMTLNGNSHVITPYQPMFIASKSSNEEPTTQTKLAFNQLSANNGAHFNTSTYTFTAPATGTYVFNYRGWFRQGTIGSASVYLFVNSTTYSEVRLSSPSAAVDYITFTPAWMVKLTAGDSVDVRGNGFANACLHTSSGITYSEFSGYFLG